MVPMSTIYAEDYLWCKVFQCLNKLDEIADSMERHVTVLEEMDKEEHERPTLTLVKS